MQKSNQSKKLICEDKFARKYACWANNHCQGWSKYKTKQRRETRRKLKEETNKEIAEAGKAEIESGC